MKLRIRMLALGQLISCVLLTQSLAEEPSVEKEIHYVAVVDIDRVFKRHVRLQNALDELESERRQHAASVVEQRRDLAEKKEGQARYNRNSTEYAELGQEIAKTSATIDALEVLKQKEFELKEARLYYNTYKEVAIRIEEFSQKYNIRMVVDFDSEHLDEDNADADELRRFVKQRVLYHHKLDITNRITDDVNRER